jgi:hypothetical protein
MWIVIEGDIADGHAFIGPFETSDAAVEWATNRPKGDYDDINWIVVAVDKPEDME